MSAAMELGGWTEEDKEHVLAAFAATIDKITGKILELRPDAPEDDALYYASGLFGAAVRQALREASDRVRAARGLPPRPETHREAASDLAEDVLVMHSGGGGDGGTQDMVDLLVDLIHYAGPTDFDDCLDAALERYEEEAVEDAGAEEEAEHPAPAAPTPAKPPVSAEERRWIARLENYRPVGYDA